MKAALRFRRQAQGNYGEAGNAATLADRIYRNTDIIFKFTLLRRPCRN
jgi:hypothetical protein